MRLAFSEARNKPTDLRIPERLKADVAPPPLTCGLQMQVLIESKVQTRLARGLRKILSIGAAEICSEMLTRPTQNASLTSLTDRNKGSRRTVNGVTNSSSVANFPAHVAWVDSSRT